MPLIHDDSIVLGTYGELLKSLKGEDAKREGEERSTDL